MEYALYGGRCSKTSFIHSFDASRTLNNIYCYYPFHKVEHQDTKSLSNLSNAS